MTKKKKEAEFEVSGSLGGVSGAVRLGSDGKILVRLGLEKRAQRRKKGG